MGLLSIVSLVGDSNVRRNLTSSTTRGRQPMSGAQFIPCGRLSTLSSALADVREDSDSVIVSCVSNFITGSIVSPSSSVSARVETLLTNFFERITSFAAARPQIRIFVCPPMYRTTPLWYRDGITEILAKFSELAPDLSSRPANILMMPSFSKSQLEADGVHLTPYSGMEFVLFLFEAAEDLATRAVAPVNVQVASVVEVATNHSHRLAVLEQDHARLVKRFDHEVAIRSEFDDFQTNLANEVFIMIQGLARLPKLDPKEWQVRALADVNAVLALLGFEPVAQYVQNSTGRGKDSRTMYKVRVASIEVSKAIRDKFASFFRGGKDSRPPSLSQISIRNCVTPATLGRVAILQLLGRRYRDSNPGSKFQVIAYEARPMLKLTPPSTASDKRVQSFNFIEAVTKLPTAFKSDEIEGLLKRISPHLHSSLRELFVVVSSDMVKSKKGAKALTSAPETPPPASGSPNTSGSSGSSGSRRRKRPAATPSGSTAKK